MPNSSQLAVERLELLGARSGRRSACRCRSVGTLWSAVATVRSGRRTLRPVEPQALEGLRRGDLVDEVEVDVEQVGLALGARGRRGGPRPSPRGCVARLVTSVSDRDDLDAQLPVGGLVLDDVAGDLCPRRAWPSGDPGETTRDAVVALLDRADEVALDLVVALVADARRSCRLTTVAGRRPRRRRSRRFEHRLELADARLHLALGVLGGVVVAVLGQVAEGAGRLDRPGRCRSGRASSGPRALARGARG